MIARADAAVPVPDVWGRVVSAVAPPLPLRLEGRLLYDAKARLTHLAWRLGRGVEARAG